MDEPKNQPKNQHYVPQTYLNRFSFLVKNKNRIYTLHKDQNKIFRPLVDNTGAENNFYTIDGYEDKYVWETTYSKNVEPLMGSVLTTLIKTSDNALIRNCTVVLNPELREKLAFTIVCQLLRGMQSRNFQRNLYHKFAPEIVGNLKGKDIEFDESIEGVIEEFLDGANYFKDISFEITLNQDQIKKYVGILLSKCVVIYKVIGKGKFITSDNPVMFINSESNSVMPFSYGLLDPRTVIHFPISPKLLVAFYNDSFLFDGIRRYDGNLLFIDDEKFVNTHNKKQCEQCFNQLYSDDESELEKLKE